MKNFLLVLMVLMLAVSANAVTYIPVTDLGSTPVYLDSTVAADTAWIQPVTGYKFVNTEDTYFACINLYSNDSTGAVAFTPSPSTFVSPQYGTITIPTITITMGANVVIGQAKIPVGYNVSGYVTITATGNTKALRVKAFKLKR